MATIRPASRAQEIGLKSSANSHAERSSPHVALFCTATVRHATVADSLCPRLPGPSSWCTRQLIRTMEPALPTATAVAVEDGMIVAVGTEDSLQPLVDARNGRIDRQFSQDILLPGFIDPHVHPALPAVLTQFPFLAPDDWSLPTGEFPGETTPEGYRARLRELVAQHR